MPSHAPDLAVAAVQALVMYGLMEHQSGQARTLSVTKQGRAFSYADDGRGHPLDKTLEGTSYLRFIYTHFDYPFGQPQGAPVQLQGIGMSMVNRLCAELTLTVRKPTEAMVITFRDGQQASAVRHAQVQARTGVSLQARLHPALPVEDGDEQGLRSWLASVATVHPGLTLLFNGVAVPPGPVHQP